MKIGIISDIHDNWPNLDKCLDWLIANGIEKIFCLGDTANSDTVSHLAEKFTGEIFLIRGNCDNYENDDISAIKNIRNLEEIGTVKIENFVAGLVHEPFKIKNLIANNEKLDFIFHGHTHKPWIEKSGRTTIANPGNLAGTAYQATFAVLDTQKMGLELKILETI